MKRLIRILSFILLIFSVLSVSVYSECGGYSWYLGRKRNGVPSFPKETALIEKYGGIYMDKSEEGISEKRLYLTFDCGYENGNTEKILDAMKEEGVTGAFFILSNLVFKSPELIFRMINEGHLVCNHTSKHENLAALSFEEGKSAITRLESCYENLTGDKMAKFFRFPEGSFSEEGLRAAKELGYTSVFWSVAYADWDNGRQMSPERAIAILKEKIHPGAIILLHPTSSTNARIMRELIRSLKAEGYKFSSLTEIK